MTITAPRPVLIPDKLPDALRARSSASRVHADELCRDLAALRPAASSRLLDHALAGLWMAYQPIVSWSAGRVIGFEALLRSDESPSGFPIPLLRLAVEFDATLELGRAVRRAVASSFPLLPSSARVFVNMERQDLFDPALLAGEDALSPFADRVVLEITEHDSANGRGELRLRVDALRALGFRIAIDDLGAGHNGFTALAELTVDVVKLDMSLVRDVHTNHTKRRVIGFVAELCREHGMLCVCEGVERPEERNALLSIGSNVFQGHLFGRPRRLAGDRR